jgi:RHS repeat-associated protein
VTTLVRPDGSRVSATYDERSRPLAVTGADGARWEFRYDTAGNVIAAIDPTGAESRYGRDARGGLTSVTDPLGHLTRISCDAAGLPVQVTDPLGGVTSLRRDAFGRVVSMTDPVGGETRFAWTVEGRLISRVSPGGGAERWHHDGEGNLVTYVDAEGRTTRIEYGPFDVPTAQIGPDGARLRFAYDTELRLTSVTNPQGLIWRYRHDAAGRLVGETDFNGWEIVYRRDPAGRLVERIDGTAQSTRFVHDLLGNVVEKRRRVLGGAGAAEDAAAHWETVASFSYDPAGRLTAAVNADADVRFERDPLGRVVAETRDGQTVTSVFDRAGRRVRRTTPSGADAVWEYDAAGRPVTMTTAGRSVVFGHDPAGREIERRIGDALLTQAFDDDHRLVEQTLTVASAAGPDDVGVRPGGVAQRRSYRYRADGHLVAVTDLLNGTREFDVDLAGRITGVHDPSMRGWAERYAYDQAGNVTNAAWPAVPGDGALGVREYTGTVIRRAGDIHYEHDAGGRVTRRRHRTLSGTVREWRYAWDGDDRLTEVVTPDGARWQYRYDAFGRRVAKLRIGDQGEVADRVDFVWDGTVLAETHAGGRATTWVHDGVRPLAQTERRLTGASPQEEIDERFYAIVTDLAGAPAEMADPGGRIVWRRRAALWGAATVVAGDVDCPLRFPGQYHDSETGFSYNVHRYYDPEIGRYQSPDPLGLTPQPNPHAYVHDPTIAADPLGLMSCTEGNPLVLNLGGEGEVAGAINLNTLIAPLRSEAAIRESGILVIGSMEKIPFADGIFDRVVGNKMPFMHGDFPQTVANESYRVLHPGGTVQLGASNVGGTHWVPYLERANFTDIHVQGRHAIGVRP